VTDSERDRFRDPERPDAAAGYFAPGSGTAVVAVAVVVFVASVVPVPSVPSSGGVAGAFPIRVGFTAPFHFLGYAVLAAVLLRAAGRERGVVAVAAAVTAATAFGFAIELVQAPIPWRSFAWSDAAVNAGGAVIGAVVAAGERALRRFRSTDRSAE
jgi:hypothetical protein